MERPEGWEDVPLGEVATFTRGITFPASAKAYAQGEGLITCLRTANVQHEVDWSDLIYVPESYVKRPDQLIRPGDILISMANSLELVGKVALVDSAPPKSTFGGFISAIRPSPRTLPKYLFYALRSSETQEAMRETASRSVNIANLALSRIGELSIPLPPLPEQQRLVEKIERLLGQSRTAREALDRIPPLLKRFRQSVLAKAFCGELTERDPNDEPASVLLERIREERRQKWEEDLQAKGKDPRKVKYVEPEPLDTSGLLELPEAWVWVGLGELLEFVGSGITPRGGRKVYVGGGVTFIRSQNVHPWRLVLDDVVHITPQQHAIMRRTAVRVGDVLLNITGASIGRSAPVLHDLGEANVNQHVCILRSVGLIASDYLSLYLNSPGGQDQIMSLQGGVTRQGLNYEQVRRIAFPLAPAGEQLRVADKLRALLAHGDGIKLAARQAAHRAEQVDQAVLARAFRGEL